nr:TetR family transcriptional regulator [Edwardsiella ictaluri]
MAIEHTSCKRAGRGRPKVFDREVALRKALELFWRQGYEATSLVDLVEATGAKRRRCMPSLRTKRGCSVPWWSITRLVTRTSTIVCCLT